MRKAAAGPAIFTAPGLLRGVFGTRAGLLSVLARRGEEAKQALQTKQTNQTK